MQSLQRPLSGLRLRLLDFVVGFMNMNMYRQFQFIGQGSDFLQGLIRDRVRCMGRKSGGYTGLKGAVAHAEPGLFQYIHRCFAPKPLENQ